MTDPVSSDYVWHSFYAVINAVPRVWPYRHLVIERFLHPALFEALVSQDVSGSLLQRHDPAKIGDTSESQRFALTISHDTDFQALPVPSLRELWRTLSDARLTELLQQKFAEDIAERHGAARVPTTLGMEVIEDRTGYALLPHVDARQKMVTVLIYLARPGDDESLGTAIYTPQRTTAFAASFRDNARLGREHFGTVTTVPYRPNTALIFAPGTRTFHGVEAVAPGTARRLIQFQINRDAAG